MLRETGNSALEADLRIPPNPPKNGNLELLCICLYETCNSPGFFSELGMRSHASVSFRIFRMKLTLLQLYILRTILVSARRTLSQFWNFKIRGTTFLDYMKFADLLILRLCNCERARRAFASLNAKARRLSSHPEFNRDSP